MPALPFSSSRLFWWPLAKLLRALAVAYLGVLLVLALLETTFVFHPVRAAQEWLPPPIDEIQEIDFLTADGAKMHGWWLPCPDSERTVLYFHGNAGNLSHRGNSVKLRALLDAAVFIIDYPGYGKCAGSPTEAGCYAAGFAAYDWLCKTQTRDPKQILLYGCSLGGGVATELATQREHLALILVKTFTSAPDVGARWFPWAPVRWIMRTRFDNLQKIGAVRTPVFIAHGDGDDVIPYEHGERLYAAANEPKQFLRLPGQNHNDPLAAEYFEGLRKFLRDQSPNADE